MFVKEHAMRVRAFHFRSTHPENLAYVILNAVKDLCSARTRLFGPKELASE